MKAGFCKSAICFPTAPLVVAEEHRGQGIGKALLDQAETWAKERSLTSVWIRSNVVRQNAHDFYLKQGYHRTKSQHVFRKDCTAEGDYECDDTRETD